MVSKHHPQPPSDARWSKELGDAARNDQRDQQIGHVGGRERALRRREAAVPRIAAPGRTILRVFRCVIANVRAWGLAATHPMFAISCMVHM